ncbi:hypothetical protein Mefer_1339 [Methanocaldococcus fervens AG86]|uniref:Uncharacterized protein n=1 Tax=Methanocaldococcus fervens (strain DSM 4213 / JCM 15782 / AG86) TaxID=573064 RepID=C7P9B5_METFA|nr:hypothetical protein Mefer_1339 [Methanocaldococcus fervens AG86]
MHNLVILNKVIILFLDLDFAYKTYICFYSYKILSIKFG